MILAVLQARSSSSRFPRKVLAPLHGKPMIVQQLDRISRSKLIDQLVVATSTEESDDELVEVLRSHGTPVHRGPLTDVAGRFAAVIAATQPTHVVRLTADCPLADPSVIDAVIADHARGSNDYTSNVAPPTFPDGLDVEVFKATAFEKLLASSLSSAEIEHVTLGFRDASRMFKVGNVSQREDHSELRWTVDVPDDLAFVARVYGELFDRNPYFGQREILALLDQNPDMNRTSEHVRRNEALESEQ